jgi:O-antigen/teichoic acid export membrane protein
MLMASILFTRIFGEKFRLALQPLLILLFSTGFSAIHVLLLGVLSTYKLTWRISRSTCIYTALILISNFILIGRMGINGAALSYTFSSITYSLIILFETKRKVNLSPRAFIYSVFPVIGAFIILVLTKNIFIVSLLALGLGIACFMIFKGVLVSPALTNILKSIDSPIIRLFKKHLTVFS